MSCYLFSWVKERGDRGSPKRFRTQRHHEHTSETDIAASEHETDSNCNKRFYLVWWTLLSGIIWWKGSIHRVWGTSRWSAHLGLAALPPLGTHEGNHETLFPGEEPWGTCTRASRKWKEASSSSSSNLAAPSLRICTCQFATHTPALSHCTLPSPHPLTHPRSPFT